MCGVEFLALLWLRSIFGGSCRNVSVSRCHKKSVISSGFALSMGEAAEMFLLQGVLRSCDVVSRGRHGTL